MCADIQCFVIEAAVLGSKGGRELAGDVTGKERAEFRKQRVKRIKRMIVITCIILLVLPTILSIFLMVKVSSLQRQINDIVESTVAGEEDRDLSPDSSPDESSDFAHAKTNAAGSPASVTASGSAAASDGAVAAEELPALSGPKKVYLTFDDGPGVQTEKILDILKEQDVQATFFVTGKEDAYSKEMYQRIIEEGHTLGMHSYSHLYNKIYGSKKAFSEDFDKIYQLLYDTTGVYPRWYRLPGGSSTDTMKVSLGDLVAVLEAKNVSYVDWNVISPEAMNPKVSKKEMVQQIIANVEEYDTAMILLYDAADRPMSVKALPALIQALKEKKYELLPLEDDTVPIRHTQLN